MTQFCINYVSWGAFLKLRERLFKAIKEIIEDPDSTWKSYEGRFDITFSLPNFFEEQNENAKAQWGIHLACYVLGGCRGYDWYGDNFDDALDKAEKDINMWLEDHEKRDKGIYIE